MQRWGMTIPLDGVPLTQQREYVEELAALGYTDVWSSETQAVDAFTPLALASVWAPSLRLGTAIVPAYTRGPATLAMSVAALASAAPGRFVLGVGSSSDVIVQRWNGIAFEQPYQRVRDLLRFLRTALTGDKVTETYQTFAVRGFKLTAPPDPQPSLFVAALREGMLRLAGSLGDGAILNWLAPEDVPSVTRYVHEGGAGKEIVARIFVAATPDREVARGVGRMAIAAYLNVPVYAAFHQWLGRGEQLKGMWDAWQAGDRKAAMQAIPDEVVDALIVHGSPDECREKIQRYVDNGVTTPVVAVLPTGGDPRQAARDLAPAT